MYRDGGKESIADFLCVECDNETVSINEDIFPYGKCATCGNEHEELKICMKCERIYNANFEGKMDLCEACYEKMERQ